MSKDNRFKQWVEEQVDAFHEEMDGSSAEEFLNHMDEHEWSPPVTRELLERDVEGDAALETWIAEVEALWAKYIAWLRDEAGKL